MKWLEPELAEEIDKTAPQRAAARKAAEKEERERKKRLEDEKIQQRQKQQENEKKERERKKRLEDEKIQQRQKQQEDEKKERERQRELNSLKERERDIRAQKPPETTPQKPSRSPEPSAFAPPRRESHASRQLDEDLVQDETSKARARVTDLEDSENNLAELEASLPPGDFDKHPQLKDPERDPESQRSSRRGSKNSQYSMVDTRRSSGTGEGQSQYVSDGSPKEISAVSRVSLAHVPNRLPPPGPDRFEFQKHFRNRPMLWGMH